MRRLRHVVWFALALVLIVGGAGAARADHGTELWAGQWTTSTGGVAWRAFNEDDLEIAKKGRDRVELWDKLPCKGGPQFYRGGYTAGDDRGKIMGCGTPTHMRGRWLSNVGGDFQNGSYEIRITSRKPLRFSGTFRQDDGVTGKYTGTWSSHFDGDGCCEASWPALPDALVPLASVSNGCGGGKAGDYGVQQKFGNTSTYLNSNNPLGTRYPVNFKSACDQHDAGYSGSKVVDPLNGGKTIDYFALTQKQVDDKFLRDMRLLCEQQIPDSAPVARADCKASGGKTSFGAKTRYDFVRSQGHRFYRKRPALGGSWSADGVTLRITQNVRYVRGTWTKGKVRGEFRGTLISRDQDSRVSGFAQTSDRPGHRHISIVVDPDTPERLEISGSALNGAFTR